MLDHTWVFYFVFLSQIFLLSFYFPRKILGRLRHVVNTYPPEQYPKLYPTSLSEVEKAQRYYKNLNIFAFFVGISLCLIGIFSTSAEVLHWDSDFVLFMYFMIQYAPLAIATTSGFVYFNLKRRTDSWTTRTAELRPRRLFDFVSPVLMGFAAVVYFAFVLLILYVQQFNFPWFGGYLNIVGITAANIFFAVVIAKNLYGKRTDPYQAPEDRARQTEITIKILIFTSIVATSFIALAIILAAFELRHYQPIAMSLYFQLLAVMSFRSFRIDGVDFEVYRADPLAT